MESRAHIPTYLLCERFAAGGRVLDLEPPDLTGARLLAGSARLVVVAQPTWLERGGEPPAANLIRVSSAREALPFGRGAFDLVVTTGFGPEAGIDRIDERVRAVRGLLHPGGLLALLVQSRDGIVLDGVAAREAPGFIDLERLLRRHFPHVVIFAQQPLHGAVLSPIGRRADREAPLFDDRLLPGGGEAPACFLALCSPRYRKVDEVVIARQPFGEFAAAIRQRLDHLVGTIDLLQHEREAQLIAAASLEQRAADLRAQLDEALMAARDKAAVEARVVDFEEALRRRDQALIDADGTREGLQRRIDELEHELQAAGHENRRLERRAAAAEQAGELAGREREEHERELDHLRQELREARTETKAKQREIDDAMEQLAGSEAELAALIKEAARQRRELISARERGRALEQELLEKEADRSHVEQLERELEQARAGASAERERLEGRIDEERRRVVESAAQRDNALRQAHESRLEADRTARELEEARSRADDLEQRRLDTAAVAEGKIADLTARLAEAEHATADLTARLAKAERETADLAARLAETEHEAAGLAERLAGAEDEAFRAGEALRATEEQAESARRLQRDAESRAVADREELERLRPRATAVEAVRGLARAAEARAEEAQVELEQARAQLSESRLRQEQLEGDLVGVTAALAEAEAKALALAAADEKDIERQQREAADLARELKTENRRLRQENESELLRVREDLETELRATARQLEAREQEIWELREEVIRLRAQGAATVAANEIRGEGAGIHRTLFEQENLIAELREECERLRLECERRQRSLDVRKKNLKILAGLLRQERSAHKAGDSVHPRPADQPLGAADSEIDIANMIEEAVDDFEDVDEALDTARIPDPVPTPNSPRDDS